MEKQVQWIGLMPKTNKLKSRMNWIAKILSTAVFSLSITKNTTME
jgi:hypothetical protein